MYTFTRAEAEEDAVKGRDAPQNMAMVPSVNPFSVRLQAAGPMDAAAKDTLEVTLMRKDDRSQVTLNLLETEADSRIFTNAGGEASTQVSILVRLDELASMDASKLDIWQIHLQARVLGKTASQEEQLFETASDSKIFRNSVIEAEVKFSGPPTATTADTVLLTVSWPGQEKMTQELAETTDASNIYENGARNVRFTLIAIRALPDDLDGPLPDKVDALVGTVTSTTQNLTEEVVFALEDDLNSLTFITEAEDDIGLVPSAEVFDVAVNAPLDHVDKLVKEVKAHEPRTWTLSHNDESRFYRYHYPLPPPFTFTLTGLTPEEIKRVSKVPGVIEVAESGTKTTIQWMPWVEDESTKSGRRWIRAFEAITNVFAVRNSMADMCFLHAVSVTGRAGTVIYPEDFSRTFLLRSNDLRKGCVVEFAIHCFGGAEREKVEHEMLRFVPGTEAQTVKCGDGYVVVTRDIVGTYRPELDDQGKARRLRITL